MSRLPTPGSDVGLWGQILNDFLLCEHTKAGYLKIRTDGTFEPALTEGDQSQYLRGNKTWQRLDKQAIGLANVDDTADVDKPVSTAAQAVLDGKMDKSGGNLAGDIIVKTKTLPTKDNGTSVAVGIGTDAPTSVVANRTVLNIEDTDGNGAKLRLNSVNALGRFYNNTQFGFGTDTAHALGIYTNGGGNTRIFITPDGEIGLNTANPTHTLTIPSTASGIASFNTSDQTDNYERSRQYWSSNTYYIKTEYGGTGVGRNFVIGSASSAILMRYFQDASGSYDLARNLNNANVTHTRISGTMTQSSGIVTGISISPTINQSSTAGYTALLINATETTTGSGAKNLIDAQVDGASKFKVDNTGRVYNIKK